MKQKRRSEEVGGREAIAADLCFFGGILSGLVGSLVTASTWLVGAELHPFVRVLGTAFLVLTIPLLILAGYCLDWMERKVRTRSQKSDHTGNKANQENSGHSRSVT